MCLKLLLIIMACFRICSVNIEMSLNWLIKLCLMHTCYYVHIELVIMKTTSQTHDSNNDSNNTSYLSSVAFIVCCSFMVGILFVIVTIYYLVKVRKISYSPNDA